MFANQIESSGLLDKTAAVLVQFYGSLGATGKGHGSDKAVIGGLAGFAPETAVPVEMKTLVDSTSIKQKLTLLGKHEIDFNPKEHLEFNGITLDFHSNGLRITAKDVAGKELLQKTYYSVGGGFVVDETATGAARVIADETELPYGFTTGQQLLGLCQEHGLSISTLMLKNETAWRPENEIRQKLLEIWSVMRTCVEEGCKNEGILPGGLKVKRRAPHMFRQIQS